MPEPAPALFPAMGLRTVGSRAMGLLGSCSFNLACFFALARRERHFSVLPSQYSHGSRKEPILTDQRPLSRYGEVFSF
jgi:hypothetical protein